MTQMPWRAGGRQFRFRVPHQGFELVPAPAEQVSFVIMGYVLYGDTGSGSAPVEMALAEAGQPVELREVPLAGDHQLAAGYRALNPMGRIPTLILPDGTVLTESLAILLTLADSFPAAGLLPPPGDPGRAAALRWMGGRVWSPAHASRLNTLAEAVGARPAIAPVWRKHRMRKEDAPPG